MTTGGMTVGLEITGRALHGRRRAIAWWVLGVAGYVGFIVAFYPTVRDDAQRFNDLVANYPKPMMDLMLGGQSLDFASPSSFVNTYLFASMIPVMVLIAAIGRGSAAVAGEEEAGTLDLVMANPITRRSFVIQKSLEILIELVVLGASIVVVLAAGAPLVELDLSITNLILATVGLVLMATDIGILALAVGAATGRRSVASGVAVAVAAAAYLTNGMSATIGWLRPMRPLSPFWWATGEDPVGNGLSPVRIAVLTTMGLVAVAAAIIAFERRDLSS